MKDIIDIQKILKSLDRTSLIVILTKNGEIFAGVELKTEETPHFIKIDNAFQLITVMENNRPVLKVISPTMDCTIIRMNKTHISYIGEITTEKGQEYFTSSLEDLLRARAGINLIISKQEIKA